MAEIRLPNVNKNFGENWVVRDFNLDAKLRVQMRAELSELHESLETTIVYVTHDQIEAMTLANRIVIMNEGRIMQEGTPLGIYENPKNVFVASFIGSPSMNLLVTKVIEENGRLSVDGGSFRLAIPENLQRRYQARVNDEVVFGIRPEHINDRSLGTNFPGSDELKAMVDVIEPVGSEVILIVTVGSHQLTAKIDPHTRASLHQPIELSFDMNNIHLFDKETGEVIE